MHFYQKEKEGDENQRFANSNNLFEVEQESTQYLTISFKDLGNHSRKRYEHYR